MRRVKTLLVESETKLLFVLSGVLQNLALHPANRTLMYKAELYGTSALDKVIEQVGRGGQGQLIAARCQGTGKQAVPGALGGGWMRGGTAGCCLRDSRLRCCLRDSRLRCCLRDSRLRCCLRDSRLRCSWQTGDQKPPGGGSHGLVPALARLFSSRPLAVAGRSFGPG
jgi:hypothetical protein